MAGVRIHTMTCTCSLESGVDLDECFDAAKLDGIEGIVKAVSQLGAVRSLVPITEQRNQKKRFGKQVSFYVRTALQESLVHVKLFSNGTLQLAGAKSEDAAYRVAALVSDAAVGGNVPVDLRIRMINGGFRSSAPLNRASLRNELVRLGYQATFDPMAYSALVLPMFVDYTSAALKNATGSCPCKCFCGAKSPRKRSCKMITIALFESGYIGITGASTLGQVSMAKSFAEHAIEMCGQHASLPSRATIMSALAV